MDQNNSVSTLPVVNAELIEILRPNPASPLPKVRQLYSNFYHAIEHGMLPFDARLPSSRDLAKTLGIARNTVIHVYEQLVTEGLLIADGRRGTRVARRVEPTVASKTASIRISQRAQHTHTAATAAFRYLPPGNRIPHSSPILRGARRKLSRYAVQRGTSVINPGRCRIFETL